MELEISWTLDLANPGEWAITDISTDCQVGWITKSDETGDWYVRDWSYAKVGGPFPTKDAACSEIETLLKHEFGIGSPGN